MFSILFLTLTSILALPIPYYFVKDSVFTQDYSFLKEENDSKFESFKLITKRIFICIIIFLIVLVLNKIIFFLSNETESLKVYLLFFILPILLNMLYLHEFIYTTNESRIYFILTFALVITLIIPVRDIIFSYSSNSESVEIEKEFNAPLLDLETLKIRFNISEFAKSYYDNETSCYIHFSNEHKQNLIIIMNSENVTVLNCKYLPDISLLRKHYSSESFKFKRIDFSDETNPIAEYILLERYSFFSKPHIAKTVYLNLQDGSIYENTSNK